MFLLSQSFKCLIFVFIYSFFKYSYYVMISELKLMLQFLYKTLRRLSDLLSWAAVFLWRLQVSLYVFKHLQNLKPIKVFYVNLQTSSFRLKFSHFLHFPGCCCHCISVCSNYSKFSKRENKWIFKSCAHMFKVDHDLM